MRFQLAAFADEADAQLCGQIRALLDNQIPFLEIRGVNEKNISTLSLSEAREVRKQLEASGLSVWSVGSPFGKYPIEQDFSAHFDQFRHGLELAESLGATRMRVFSFYTPKTVAAETYTDEVLERLSRFCDAAAAQGITLCHENEKGIYGDIPSRCATLHTALPSLRAVFDPANFVQCGVDTREAWDLLAGYVEYLHIKDCAPDGTIVPAGYGIGNIPYLLEQYRGQVLTLEPHLAVFQGLAELEAGEQTKIQFRYTSNREAFDAAVSALRKLI